MGIQINGNTNNINAGIGSLSIEDLREIDIVGVATASNFKTGSSNLHSTGLTVGNTLVHSTGVNVGTGATVHSPATNVLTLGTNSDERLRISSNGLVNIGAGSNASGLAPLLHLHKNASNSTAYLHITNNTTGITNNDGFLLGINGVGDCLVFNKDNTPIRFATQGLERLRIDSSGRVIIGKVMTAGSGDHYDDITINNSNQSGNAGSAGIDLIASNDAYGGIIFSDEDAYEQGFIKYWHNSNADKMRFGTNSNDRWEITKDGYWVPVTDSSYDIGSNAVRVRNVYADTLYGDGSNLTGLPAGVTINNNANNRIITGNTGTTLDAESTLTYDGNTLKFGGGSAPSNTTYYNDIVIDNSDTASGAAGGAGIKLYSGNQTWGGLIFGDSDADQVGYVKYSHIENYLTLAASGSERLRIESAGGGTISAKNCTGAFAVPLGTTAQRPTGATGMVRFNTTTNKLEVYNGTEWKVVNFQADPFGLSYLIIGGGGAGGGNYRGGGGGAGGYRTNWNSENQGGGQSSGATFTVNPNAAPTYSIVVGAGGAGVTNTHGGDGGQSKFDTITADGGGGGGHYSTKDGRPSPGNGSGGGGGSPNRAGGSSGTYGYNGGQGGADNQQCGGGGGGAALVGYAGNNSGTGGDGGTALASTITGSSVLRAGGGGGGAYGGGNNIPVGGGGGAGNGRYGNNPYQNGLSATANTGSGGGGSSGSSGGVGGNGGSGVVILRYPSTANTIYSSGVTKTTTTVGTDTVDIITATSTVNETVSFTG